MMGVLGMCGGGKPLLWVEETVLSEVLDGLRAQKVMIPRVSIPPMEMDLRPRNFHFPPWKWI